MSRPAGRRTACLNGDPLCPKLRTGVFPGSSSLTGYLNPLLTLAPFFFGEGPTSYCMRIELMGITRLRNQHFVLPHTYMQRRAG